ncbi:hypothetical protein ABKN59_008649 [Abortiporus biennis]
MHVSTPTSLYDYARTSTVNYETKYSWTLHCIGGLCKSSTDFRPSLPRRGSDPPISKTMTVRFSARSCQAPALRVEFCRYRIVNPFLPTSTYCLNRKFGDNHQVSLTCGRVYVCPTTSSSHSRCLGVGSKFKS